MNKTLAPQLTHHTADDGYRFAVRVWNAVEPAGRIVLIHGIVSHGGWYLASCRHLAREGFEVHALDRRGSGLNLQQRGDVPDCETWFRDVAGYLQSLPPARATILLGISWGGKFVPAFARQQPALVDAFGMLCPGLFARQIPGPLSYLALHTAATVGLASIRVPIPLQDPALFTASSHWQNYIHTDPFSLRQITVRFALADRELTRSVSQSPTELHKPALLVLAERDQMVHNERTREFFEHTSSPDRTLIEYPGAEHTLEFEPNPMPFLDDLTAWSRRIADSVALARLA